MLQLKSSHENKKVGFRDRGFIQISNFVLEILELNCRCRRVDENSQNYMDIRKTIHCKKEVNKKNNRKGIDYQEDVKKQNTTIKFLFISSKWSSSVFVISREANANAPWSYIPKGDG